MVAFGRLWTSGQIRPPRGGGRPGLELSCDRRNGNLFSRHQQQEGVKGKIIMGLKGPKHSQGAPKAVETSVGKSLGDSTQRATLIEPSKAQGSSGVKMYPGEGEVRTSASVSMDVGGPVGADEPTGLAEDFLAPSPQPDIAVMRIDPIFRSGYDLNMGSKWIWQQIGWPKFSWDKGALVVPLAKAEGAQGRLRMLSQILSPAMTQEALAEILKVEGVSTSAIEGKYLDPGSVAASVARHLGLPAPEGASVSRDSEGVISVLMDATARFQEPLTEARLCGWQKSMFPESKDQKGILVGALREGWVGVLSGTIGRERVHFEGVPAHTVKENLQRFLDWFNASAEEPALVRAGIAHLWLVTIHPFDDGNGRVSRAVTDLAIAQMERRPDYLFRMSGRIEAVKGDYYAALIEAQGFGKGLDITPWLVWFSNQVAEACSSSEKIIQRTLAKATFWVHHSGTDLNPHQRKALNRLLDAGPGGFAGGLTAKKYAGLTHVSIPTATRHLAELVVLGCLIQSGGGRSTSYDIPWEQFIIQP